MDEDCAATACDARAGIVVEFDDEIVESVLPPQTVSRCSIGNVDWPVIETLLRVLAPSIIPPDLTDRQKCLRPGHPVGSPPKPDQPEAAPRGATIPLALVGKNAAAPESDWNLAGTGH